MRGWHDAGLTLRSAFESQALLQLATEYCAAKRCAECPVGRRILNLSLIHICRPPSAEYPAVDVAVLFSHGYQILRLYVSRRRLLRNQERL